MSTTTLIFVAVVIFWIVGAYNRLMRHKNAISNAFGPIDAQLKCRYDLTLRIVEAFKKYLFHDHDKLDMVMSSRNLARAASDVVRSRPTHAPAVASLSAAEDTLGGALNGLFAVATAYPELKTDITIRELEQDLSRVGVQVTFACQAYNAAVVEYNNAQCQFPALLIARLFGFTLSAQLPLTEVAIERQPVHVQV